MQTEQREGFSQTSSEESGHFNLEEGKALCKEHAVNRSSCGPSELWERG